MKTLTYRTLAVVGMMGALALAGCAPDASGTGTVRGRVIGMNGQPVSNARVAVDRVGGRSTLTNTRGEFRIAARDGSHTVLAFSVQQDAGGSVNVHVEDGDVVDIGDVGLTDCDVLAADVPLGAPEGGDGSSPNAGGEPGSDGLPDEDDPALPCVWEEPPPPQEHVTFASLEGEFSFGYVDTWGISGYADDSSQEAGFDFWIGSDLTGGGNFSGHVVNDYENGIVDAHVGLYTYDSESGWGYYYVLREGDVSVTVSDDGDDDPSTLEFTFSGTNLSFDYAGWNGIESDYTATVGEATASGEAWQYIPPAPPTEDITVTTFVADWKYISLCTACAMDGGDSIFVYAWDETNQADLSFSASVSDFTLGGSAELAMGGDVYGWASIYTEAGSWGYELDHLTATAGSTFASGEILSLTLSDAQFDYLDAYGGGGSGGVVVGEDDPAPGMNAPTGTEPAPAPAPSESEFQLFIGSADLSAIVDDYGCDCGLPPGGGEGDPGMPGEGGGEGGNGGGTGTVDGPLHPM